MSGWRIYDIVDRNERDQIKDLWYTLIDGRVGINIISLVLLVIVSILMYTLGHRLIGVIFGISVSISGSIELIKFAKKRNSTKSFVDQLVGQFQEYMLSLPADDPEYCVPFEAIKFTPSIQKLSIERFRSADSVEVVSELIKGQIYHKGSELICRRCGAINETEAIYCEKCGYPLVCPCCGHEIDVEDDYCGACGHKL